MNIFGSCQIALQFGSRLFEWSFLLADVSMPILGSNFLCHHHLLVDVAGSRLLDTSTLEPIPTIFLPGKPGKHSELFAVLLSTTEEFRDLLAEHPDEISSKGFSVLFLSIWFLIVFQLLAKARRLDTENLECARKEFAAMEAAGAIPLSNSPLASPLQMVQKPDSSWCSCGDYHCLSTMKVPDRYPLPNVADFTSCLKGCTVFTKLDLTKGYYLVPMAKGDILKMPMITPFDLFAGIGMLFGLMSAGFTFQRMMDQILGEISNCFVCVDDILIASQNSESHIRHVCHVLNCLRL